MNTSSTVTLHFPGKFYKNKNNQTVGLPPVGSKAVEVFENRRNVTRLLTPEGKVALQNFKSELASKYNCSVTSKFSIYAGCKMCPCSPGFIVTLKGKEAKFEYVWVEEDGSFEMPELI